MKKTIFLFVILWVVGLIAQAQTQNAPSCKAGFCPETITVKHVIGDVSPQSANINYQVVQKVIGVDTTCWIAQNLGALNQPVSSSDASASSAGYIFQFNRKQGHWHDGTTLTPSPWEAPISDPTGDWQPENDPCTLLLGSRWRIPTKTEWESVNDDWTDVASAYASDLKLHPPGQLYYGSLYDRGIGGAHWTSTYNSGNEGWITS